MSEAQTWRVVLASGEVREVVVGEHPMSADYAARCHLTRGASNPRRTARGAVLDLVAHDEWPVAEILAPGEPTRAEIAAQARREGVEVMRAEIRRALWQSWSGDQLAALARVALPEVPR